MPGVELTAKTPSTSATGSATATLTTKASAAGNTTTGSGTQATDNTKAAGKSIAAQTSETSASAKAPGKGGGSGSSSTKSGRLESTVAGLKRKKLHADNTGGDSPLLRKVRSKIMILLCHPQISHALGHVSKVYFLIRSPCVLTCK